MVEVSEPTSEMSTAAVSWRWAVYGGAVLGGIFWGVVAAVTAGAPGDEALHAVQDRHRLVLAAVVTVGCLVVGGLILGLLGSRTAPGPRLVRSLGVAVMIGPMGGWLVFASLMAQGYSMGWG